MHLMTADYANAREAERAFIRAYQEWESASEVYYNNPSWGQRERLDEAIKGRDAAWAALAQREEE